MRIFFVCRRVPFPPDRGDKIATFNEIRHLSANHEVHVFCLGDGARDLDNIAGLEGYAKTVTAAAVSGLKIKLRALKALTTGRVLSVVALDEPDLHTAIRRKYDELRPDLIIVYSSNVAQFAEPFADVPRIMQFGDLDSLKWRQYADRSRIPLRWVYEFEERRLFAYERHLANTFSAALVHTEIEKRDFERLIPEVPVTMVGNGVDLDYFRSSGAPKQPASIIFTGVMNYRPNIDAVVWFCREILPIVQSQISGATLTICGSRPASAVRRLVKQPGVAVTGWVADTRPYVDRAEIFVAPLRMARACRISFSRRSRWDSPASLRRLPGEARFSKRETAFSRPTSRWNLPSGSFACCGTAIGAPRWRAERGERQKRIIDGTYRWPTSIIFWQQTCRSRSHPPRRLHWSERADGSRTCRARSLLISLATPIREARRLRRSCKSRLCRRRSSASPAR